MTGSCRIRKSHIGLLMMVQVFWVAMFSAYASDEPVRVREAWTRAGVPGQKVAAVYFNIVPSVDAKLIAVNSDIAELAEFHEMMVDDGIMRMRPLNEIDVHAGEMLSLRPGGVHVMLFNLNEQLRPGEQISLILVVRDANGATSKIEVEADVRNLDGTRVEKPVE